MNTDGKSDEPIVPSTPANNGSAELSAESGEESGSTKRNDVQAALSRTQGRIEHKSRGLPGVREAARSGSTLKFTALLHHVNEDCLTEAFFNLKKRAAVGVDGITWHEYERDVEVHIANLHSRIHRGAYRAKPSRRVWIPKSDGRKRPLGIASLPWSSRRCPGHRVAGGQDCPTSGAVGIAEHLRTRLSRLQLWLSAWSQPARRTRCVVRGGYQ